MKERTSETRRASREAVGAFWVGILVLFLGVIASFAYGSRDGQRLFFCSSVVLATAWIAERRAARSARGADGAARETEETH